MTEQEKREKAIEEMAKRKLKISAYYGQHKQEIDKMWEDTMSAGCLSTALPFMVCIYSRMADYRKEEEVRKETAIEILQEIASDFYSIGDGYFELTKHDIQELMQKFGVEVEE